jgi:Protein of unknown function (DUF3187)
MRIYLFLILLLLTTSAISGFFTLSEYHRFGPMTNRTQNPIYLLFLDESLERGVSSLKKNNWILSLDTIFSNMIEKDCFYKKQTNCYPLNKEFFDIDAELWRTSFAGAYGVSDSFSMGFEIPFLAFSGGFLDQFIDDFHGFFGFPNGGRDLVSDYRLTYIFRKENASYKPKPTPFGIGDIVFWNKLQVLQESMFMPALSLKISLKLPTGSPDSATGSGTPDAAVSAYLEKSYKRFHSYTHFGAIAMGGMEKLNSVLKIGQLSFGQAFEINVTEFLSFVGQLKGNTPLFKNIKADEFAWPVLDLSFGFTGNVPVTKQGLKIHYEFAFVEDILFGGPTVDFSVFFKTGVLF